MKISARYLQASIFLLIYQRVQMKKILLGLLFLYALFFVVGSTMAPICAHLGLYELSAKLTSLFMYSCHQQPTKSFWLLGYPVALCARCLGVYLGTCVSCIKEIFFLNNSFWKVNLFLFLIALVDLFINYILKFNTGVLPRFLSGIFIGMMFPVVISWIDYLIKKGKIKNV